MPNCKHSTHRVIHVGYVDQESSLMHMLLVYGYTLVAWLAGNSLRAPTVVCGA